jgi:hypothetical protein
MIKYLEAHQGSAKYMIAAVGSNTAGAIALQSARNVIDMGGFMGADPAPTLAQVEHLIDTGQLHYILLGGQGGGGTTGSSSGGLPGGGEATGGSDGGLPGGGEATGGSDGSAAAGGPGAELGGSAKLDGSAAASRSGSGVGGSGATGGPGVGGPGGAGASNATIETRDRWIEAHGTVVHVPEQSTSGSGTTLYYIAR